MRIIGITGGIGTGKSTVLTILKEQFHAYIVETDKLAHELMKPNQSVYNQIIKIFGKNILKSDQTIDREKLGNIVFNNKNELEKLNNIIHPEVKKFIIQDIKEKKRENIITYYVIEAALLIEDGYKMICDELWYIYTEKEERIHRLLLGRGGSREKWETIIEKQSSEEYYRQNCDVVIDNGRSIKITQSIINELLF